jgi:hypothetical protein
MLNALPKEKDDPFRSCYPNLYRDYINQRKTIAKKLQPKTTPHNIPHIPPLESHNGIPQN